MEIMLVGQLWRAAHPDPSLEELVDRYSQVLEIVTRFREADIQPFPELLCELGVCTCNAHIREMNRARIAG